MKDATENAGTEGYEVGREEGQEVVGALVGTDDAMLGLNVGGFVGTSVGIWVGARVGEGVGDFVGWEIG